MFDNYSNYDSITADREREEKLMQDKRERCHQRGKLYFILFWLSVLGTPVILLISVVGSVIAVLLDSMGFLYLVVGGLALLGLAVGIVTAVILFILGKEESCFKAAGIAYIIIALSSAATEFLPDGLLKTVLKLVTLIAEMFYLFEFINGSIYILAGVDNYLASSWETIRKVIIYLCVGVVAAVILMFIPILSIISAIAIIIAAIAAIVVLIWEWVLMFKTASALKNF